MPGCRRRVSQAVEGDFVGILGYRIVSHWLAPDQRVMTMKPVGGDAPFGFAIYGVGLKGEVLGSL
jgi:hypothetical protein